MCLYGSAIYSHFFDVAFPCMQRYIEQLLKISEERRQTHCQSYVKPTGFTL